MSAETIARSLASRKVSPKGPGSGMRMLTFPATALGPLAETLYIPHEMSFDGGKTTTWIMTPVDFPESYVISVSGLDKNGKQRTEEFYVTQDEFSRLQLGDTYTCGEVRQCVTDRPGGRQMPQ